jgi:hypothetical protein
LPPDSQPVCCTRAPRRPPLSACYPSDIQGATGPDEASRAIRKKLKYGSVHRQIRALTLLKALSENSRTFPKSFASSPQLLDRLRETARDYHTDPDVKRRLMGVLKGWKVQHDEGDRAFSRVAGMWAELGGSGAKRVRDPLALRGPVERVHIGLTISRPESRAGFDTPGRLWRRWRRVGLEAVDDA